jgi:predicted RNA-binding protein YlqC (UPF0109 family)
VEEFVKRLVEPLFDYPDHLKVHSTEKDGILTIPVSVAKEDPWRVVGRKGSTATALRVLVMDTSASGHSRAPGQFPTPPVPNLQGGKYPQTQKLTLSLDPQWGQVPLPKT